MILKFILLFYFFIGGKRKKKPNKDFISKLQKELKTDLDAITDNSELFKYLDKKVFVKDYYGDKGRIYKLEKI